MTNTHDEMTTLATEREDTTEIKAKQSRLDTSRKARRALPRHSEALQIAEKASELAQAKADRLTSSKAEGEGRLAALNARLDDGDESVSVDQIVFTEEEVKRAGRLLVPATKEAKQANRVLGPLQADDHLAHLFADAVDQVHDAPTVICKVPSEAPAFEPLIVVSQTTPTKNYGRLDASGQVQVTTKGADLDSGALKRVLEDMGSEVGIANGTVTFLRANWPTPRLAEPSANALSVMMVDFEEAFRGQVAGGAEMQRLVEAGYSIRGVRSEWNGLLKRGSETLTTATPGEAIGTARFVAAIQHDRGDSTSVEEVKSELETLVSTFQSCAVGGWGEAGQIEAIELLGVEEYRGEATPWTRGEVPHVQGVTAWPVTVEAALRVTYSYEVA